MNKKYQRVMRKGLSGVAVFLLLFSSLLQPVTLVFAQEATDSGSLATSSGNLQVATASAQIISVTPTPEQNPFQDTWTSYVGQTTTTNQPTFTLGNNTQTGSAQTFQPPSIGKLTKHSFKENEPVSLTIANEQASGVQVVLTDPKGKPVDPNAIQKSSVGTQTTITVNPTSFVFTPGKYMLQITDSTGQTSTQDFTWGVLALNTDKSLYLPNQTADISMAVLDDTGMQVCNADVSLTISGPNGTTTLTTKDKTIAMNSQCFSHDMSTVPDYEAHYQFSSVGNYQVTLSAATKNGTNSIDDTFHVVASVPFDVQRISATRLYPYNTYPMIFHITANQDFTGNVVETAPSNFQISPLASASAQTFNSTNLVMPIPNMMQEFGQPTVKLALPFAGNYPMVQGFGVALTDPIEKAFYDQFGLAGHDGLDFAMPDGTKVLAADSGTVSYAGDGVYGTMVVVDHSWGRSYYGHLSSTEVKAGDSVTQGQEIGLSGQTGHVTGPHLHFGIKPKNPDMANGFYGKVDPTPYLAALSSNSDVLGIATADISTSEKIISWNVSLQKGESIDLGYNYQSPPQSPAFYTLGPLKFVDNNKTVAFQEARTWQLAIDADSTASGNCSTSANDTSTGAGTKTWGTVGSNNGACANAGTTTTGAVLTSSVSSEYLKTTGFGFSLPTNAIIDGIQVSITKKCTNNSSGRCVDKLLHLVKAGTVQTSDTSQADTSTTWGTSNGTVTYGSATSIPWGGTWGPSDINNSGFGIAFSAAGNSTRTVTATLTGFISMTISYNTPPSAPTSLTATNITGTGATLQMTATDPESDNVSYYVQTYSNSTDCNSQSGSNLVDTGNQSSSSTGWSGTGITNCSGTNDCYPSGTAGNYSIQTSLSSSTTYWFTAKAKDPLGSNTYSAYTTSCVSFTTGAAGPTLDQLMRHGQWFNSSGVIQPFSFVQ